MSLSDPNASVHSSKGVGGLQDAAPLVALAEDLKEQFRASAGEWDESQFVDDQPVEPGKLSLRVQQPSLVTGFHQVLGQGGGGG